MRVLVTGGAGFIGSHLVEELVKRGDEVWIIDNLLEGKINNIREVRDKVVFCGGDVRETLINEYFRVVYHLAAKRSVPKSFLHPKEYFDVNINGTWNILSAYGRRSRIVNISSSSAEKCLSPYAISKRTTELLCMLYPKAVSLRLFNVFGERQLNTGCVIPAFTLNMINNKTPFVYGDGNQSKDFTYVGDVVREIMEFGEGKYKKENGIFDIGYGQSHSVNELFERIGKLTNYECLPPIHLAKRQGDTDFSQSTRKMENVKYGFEIGLERTVEWFKNERRDVNAARQR